jgi:hypothetical protein
MVARELRETIGIFDGRLPVSDVLDDSFEGRSLSESTLLYTLPAENQRCNWAAVCFNFSLSVVEPVQWLSSPMIRSRSFL